MSTPTSHPHPARLTRPIHRSRRVLSIVAVLVVAMSVIAFVALRWYLTPQLAPPASASPAAGVLSALAAIPATDLQTVGTGDVSPRLVPIGGRPLLSGTRPQVLYIGAEYCPACATLRWPLVVAVSRFGSLAGGGLTTSSSRAMYANTPTLTFHGARYTSDHIDFVAVETADRQGEPLDRPSTDQLAVMREYDAPPYTSGPGALPFVDFGNRYIATGAPFSPELLLGSHHQYIVRSLSDHASPLSRAVLGAANYYIAAICVLTGGRPEEVCGATVIRAIQQKLANGA